MGPSASAFWLETLHKVDLPKREYIPLADAASELKRLPSELLDKAISGELDIYAPVLDEGTYVWPVTEYGLRHSRILGKADPIFTVRLKIGDYAILTIPDLKKIKLGASVKPEGFICPAITLLFIDDWETERQSEQALKKQMSALLYPRVTCRNGGMPPVSV